ncbi:MAG: hypothetical protein EBQ56_10345 [Proteobacteria bacterium]|nr:hypothetical protein [Pseudomonadota bacterium]NBQ31322.1 hypothetical protein [Pseudomonadota bacterium]NBX47919.1 hypothetical protein [Chloroflexota bacterium]NBY48148.1 hypothetical protein [Pseudomonadota bacterium]
MVGRNDPHAWGPECPWGGSAHHAVRLAFFAGSEPTPPPRQASNDHETGKPGSRRVTRLSWACTFTSFVLLALIVSWLLAIHAKVIGDVSSARIPLASAPGGLLIVALAFGIATWVGDILPSWIQSDREPHDPSLPLRFPVASWCTDCNRNFVDIGPTAGASSGQSRSVTIGSERVARPASVGEQLHDIASNDATRSSTKATTNLN